MIVFTEGLVKTNATDMYHGALNALQNQRERFEQNPPSTVFLQRAPVHELPWNAGLPGLARSAIREYPNLEARVLSFTSALYPSDEAVETAAKVITHRKRGEHDSLYVGEAGQCWAERLELVHAFEETPRHQIKKDDVFLVTGGGQGITAACTIALAKRTKARFILTGRTQPIDDPNDWPSGLPANAGLIELRTALATQSLLRSQGTGRDRKTPKEIARLAARLIATRSINQTLSTIRDAGATADYISMDLGSASGVTQAIERIQQQYGAITGLIHGAGVLADRRLGDISRRDLDVVFKPKIDGLQSLLRAIPTDQLRHIGLFSSAAAQFGNAGQANYAMANEALNAVADALKRDRPFLNAKAFGWGPWDGGMVSNSLKATFEARGIQTIPFHDGAELFADAMLAELEPSILAIGAI
ncbi:MAG: SDR family NAD(P)-dependent oxidoreductase [Pseudomonadota bacterium]